MEIAVYGGTFNPPTIAHEAVIEACLTRPDIDEVWVMPSGERADKAWQTTNEDRLAMLGLVKQTRFGNNDRLQIITHELDAPGATETWTTVQELARQHPEDTLHYVYGADSYLDMPNWRNGLVLQRDTNMLLIPRDGYVMPEEDEQLAHLTLTIPCGAVSSTGARLAAAEGRPLEGVNPTVARFILRHGLYQYDTIE